MKRKLIVALGLAVIMALSLICLVACGTSDNEHVHTWATEWSHDGAEHWHACGVDGCDERNEVAAHSGGTATCKTKAKCAVCGVEYGELNGENHESTEFTYTANSDGTHKKAYKCCGAVVEANEACSGGTATCKTKAKCALCGGEYGELNGENHESTEFTYTANNDGTHKKAYKCCGATVEASEACSGGTATCVAKAVCTLCGAEYGELSTEHVWATELSHDETNHWYACTVVGCTAKKDDAAHLGGTATCKTKATCTACGTVYGGLNAENHESAEFTYTANNDGTHKKMHKCCGAVVEANEACSGGTATCVAKAVCTLCEAEYGELSTVHAYANGLDTTNEVYDYKKCVCGKLDLEHGFKKTVDNDNQQLVMTSEAIALNLEGVSDYDAVKSITLGEANLGTNVNALELGTIKTDEKQHGTKTIKVIVTDADGLDHEINVNVILVTQVITTDAELKTLLREEKISGGVQQDVYGYYVLGNDIVYTGSRNYVKFMGTFDGNEKTITTSELLNGLFTYAWDGCIIKDLTIKTTLSPLASNYRTVLANNTYNATIINLAVIYEGGADSAGLNDGGFLFREGATKVNFVNLTISATGKKIGSLLGKTVQKSTFTNCVIYADEVNCAAGMKDGSNRVEIADVEGLEVKQIAVKEIALWQETTSLDYGDMFAGKTVESVACGNYLLGNNLASLVIPEELKANKQLHGNTVIGIKFTDGAKSYLPVILVTAEINTTSEFEAAVMIPTDDTTAKFGYYKLGKNLDFNKNVNGGYFWGAAADKKSDELGFRGTLDGNGYTISTIGEAKVYNGGFFGLLGKGAVVKNVKFNVSMHANAIGLFASHGRKALIQDVEVTFISVPTNANTGAFFGFFSGSMTCKNVVVKAAGLDIVTIFGCNMEWSDVPTCENVVVNAKSLGSIGRKGWGGDPVTTLKGFTFNETLA